MKSMNKYLLLTSSAMILARFTSAALEADAKESKAVVNNLEFNQKFSELNPPSLVIPPLSSAKDYKRLAGVCFLGIGDCGGGLKFDKGDDYTKGCDPINPCEGFTLTSTGSCTEGYTSCNTGCETKYKCKPPSYTQTCSYPYQGVGSPLNGKYKECECRPEFKYTTGSCPSPAIPDTTTTSCDGKYTSCICPFSFQLACNYPEIGVGPSCGERYESCECRSIFDKTCEGQQGVGDSCNGLYAECSDLPCADQGFTQTCSSPMQGVGEACDGKYKSCECPAKYNQTCEGRQGSGEACNGLYAQCTDIPCAQQGYTQTCSGVQQGVGEACDGKYKSCECRSDLVSCSSAEVGVGASCGGKYASCNCRSDLVTCVAPKVGVGTGCRGLYASCACPSSYNKTCTGVYNGAPGEPCDGLWKACQCRSDLVSCSDNQVGVGAACGGKYTSCKCKPEYNKTCSAGQSCSASCGGLCSSCYTPSSGGGSTGGGGGWGYSSYDDDMCSMYMSYC